MSEATQGSKRRTFLVGLVTGAGAAAAVAAVASVPEAAAKKAPTAKASPSDPVLFRRTEEAERYYRTLYT